MHFMQHVCLDAPVPPYTTVYITTHKQACRVAVFNADGRFAATGSEDTSLKVLDVSKMTARVDADASEEKPVVRTLYDHQAVWP